MELGTGRGAEWRGVVTAVPAPVVVLGLDGATWTLLGPLAERGVLPNLEALRRQGAWGTLRSTVPALTLPAWGSFLSGKNPGGHGLFAFQRLAADRYESPGLANAADLRAVSFVEVAGRAGKRVGMVSVPPSYPLRPLPNGYVVGCMLTPPGQAFTLPPELRDELGPYVIDTPPPKGLRPEASDYTDRSLAYLSAMREQTRLRGDAIVRLLACHPTDLLCAVFYGPDRVQHYFWQFLVGDERPQGPGGAIHDGALAVLVEMDAAIGRIVAAAGPEATMVLVSDHGFGRKPETAVRVNRWLADAGLLRRHAFWKLRRKVIRKLLPARLRVRYDTLDHILVDRPHTRAWSEALFTATAGIWVHVRGRYPLGCVAPGAEYERVRDEIVTGLGALTDGAGRRVFLRVGRREDFYRGPFVALAPDVVAVCAPEFGIVFESLRRELRDRGVFGPWEELGYTGVHDPDGVYLLAGPAIARCGPSLPYPIEAIAPTVLHLLGLPVPADMEAPVMGDVLAAAFLADHPVQVGEAAGTVTDVGASWGSEADEAQIAEHLRALGYLE